MLTNYENKVLLPNAKQTDICPSCQEGNWKQVIIKNFDVERKAQKYLVCRRCGHVKKVKK